MQRRLRDRPEIPEEGLYILGEEYGDWEESSRRIDLLALDSKGRKGRLVVIELKRSDSDSLMDLQAIRYAAMVADMTFQQATEAHRRYLESKEQKGEDAASLLRQHLVADDAEIGLSSGNPRILLVSATFSKELTTSVMWLNRTGLDITCVRLQPYKSADGLYVESSQVIPIPELADYLVRLRNREEEAQQQQVAGPGVVTSPGGDQFLRAIQSAQERERPKLTLLYETAISLENEGLAELVTRSGSLNTVLRLHLPGSGQGLVYVYTNKPGYGYLQFNGTLFDSRAPESKARLEKLIWWGHH